MRTQLQRVNTALGLTSACVAGLSACKSRDFNASRSEQASEAPRGAFTRPPLPATFKTDALRASLALLLPPANDAKSFSRLPGLLDLGISPSRFSGLLALALGEPPDQKEIEARDVFNADTPSKARILRNGACVRDASRWKLTHIQFLPFERLVDGSYTNIAAFERATGTRIVVPFAFQGTFQPICKDESDPASGRLVAQEQALQLEWRIYDLDANRQRALAALVAKHRGEALRDDSISTTAEANHDALVKLAESFETPERANTRQGLLREFEFLATSWYTELARFDPSLMEPLAALQRDSLRVGIGFRNTRPAERSPLHPAFRLSSQLLDALRAFLKQRAVFENLHAVRTSLSEVDGSQVHSLVVFENEKAVPAGILTKQMVRRTAKSTGKDVFHLQPLLAMGRFVSDVDTGHTLRFQSEDLVSRKAFDEVDLAPTLLAALPAPEVSALRKRLADVNRTHPSTTHCTLCHALGGGRILSGQTAKEGLQISTASLLRATQDAPALARELENH